MDSSTSRGTSERGEPSAFEPCRPSKRSHTIGMPILDTTCSTAPVTSGPMPSPGMSVTRRGCPSPGEGMKPVDDDERPARRAHAPNVSARSCSCSLSCAWRERAAEHDETPAISPHDIFSELTLTPSRRLEAVGGSE